jgi:hypothetical protein
MAKKTIGPKIKDFRKRNNLTQDALAASLGYYGKSVISHIEKGDADMTYEKIALLLKVYNLDANELFDVEGKPSRSKERAADKPEVEEQPAKRVAIYIHGLNGSAKEAKDYGFLKDKYDVVGLDYKDGKPWELKDVIQSEFKKLSEGYDEVVVIANSIGAFYACEYLSKYNINKAFFISPIVSMFQQVVDLMEMYNIKDKELKEKGIIELEDGNVLSFEFYQHVANEEDHWKVPTEILYGAYDQVVYTGSMMEFLENHPNARLTVKSDAEHYFYTPEEKRFIKNWILKSL